MGTLDRTDEALHNVLGILDQKRKEKSGSKQQEMSSSTTTTTEYEAEKLREKLERAGIHDRYRGVTFAAIERRGLPENPSIRGNYQIGKEYAANLPEHVKNGKGLILTGGYGTMKTTIATAILRDWLDTGHNGLIVPMCSLIDNLYTMRVVNRQEFAEYDWRVRTTPLLVLDDMGGEDTDQRWVLAKVDSIITDRYNRKLPTIVTTNLPPKELAGTYSGRILDRLMNTAELLMFNAKSQRRHYWEVQ